MMNVRARLLFFTPLLLVLVGCARAAESPAGVVLLPTGPPREVCSSHTGSRASDVLKESELAEAQAAREAVAADIPSRDMDESEKSGFRSWSELYQWAVSASTEGASTYSSGKSLSATARESDLEAADDEHMEENAVFVAPANRINSDSVESGKSQDYNSSSKDQVDLAQRLAELENVSENLPEFESEIVILERAVAKLNSYDVRTNKAIDRDTETFMVHALDVIAELCHSGDNGRDLHTLGGLKKVIHLLDAPSSNSAIHQASAKAISVCSQNNPPVAEAAVNNLGAIPPLLDHACAADAPPATRARALMALAALIESPATRKIFNTDRTLASRVVTAMRLALHHFEDSQEHRRGALRALALAEGIVRQDNIHDGYLQQWKERFAAEGVLKITEELLKNQDSHRQDFVEAAARLATALDL